MQRTKLESWLSTKESDLSFLKKSKLLFETVTLSASEPKYIFVFMGKLSSHTQDRILNAYGLNNLSFENLMAYFRKQEEQDKFKGLLRI